MDARTERLAEAIGGIWAAHVPETPLREIRFGDPGYDAYATMQYRSELAGVKMVIAKRESTWENLWLALHETAHGAMGDGVTEETCNTWASNYIKTWAEPVKAFVDRGDPRPWRELCKTMEWGRKQAERKRAERQEAETQARLARARWKAAAIQGRRDLAARTFAGICKKHGVKSINWSAGWASPSVTFEDRALKATEYDPEFEAHIRKADITEPEGIRWLRRVWERRKKYISWVKDLMAAGLIPAIA